jgi:hypothetical protein
MKRVQMSPIVNDSFYLCRPSANPFGALLHIEHDAKQQLAWLETTDGGEFCWYCTMGSPQARNELWFSRQEDMILYQMTWC